MARRPSFLKIEVEMWASPTWMKQFVFGGVTYFRWPKELGAEVIPINTASNVDEESLMTNLFMPEDDKVRNRALKVIHNQPFGGG